MSIRILQVIPDSPAWKAGILPDEYIISINGEEIQDEIDYQACCSVSRLSVTLSDKKGLRQREVLIHKPDWEPLGLCLDETVALKPRPCRNHCLFCFIDQMPKGMRKTLYVKDDDWRLSLMMGNYITLTNVSDDEFDRILRRKVSPLYISIHATDPSVRCRLLRNPSAGNLMPRLSALKEAGLHFHGQIVLCPGINDGDVLKKTIEDFAFFFPAAQSLAIVPVGMTKYREHLSHLEPVDPEKAREIILLVQEYQKRFLSELGTRMIYCSDEFYCVSGIELPSDESYEGYGQIENGVGMIRLLEEECREAMEDLLLSDPLLLDKTKKEHLMIPTGVSVYPYIDRIVHRYAPEKTTITVLPVVNRFFGETITVTGLLVGQDIIDALKMQSGFDRVLLSDTMLRENTDCFLDDLSLKDVEQEIGKPIRVVSNGESLIRALYGMEDHHD